MKKHITTKKGIVTACVIGLAVTLVDAQENEPPAPRLENVLPPHVLDGLQYVSDHYFRLESMCLDGGADADWACIEGLHAAGIMLAAGYCFDGSEWRIGSRPDDRLSRCSDDLPELKPWKRYWGKDEHGLPATPPGFTLEPQ